jgi:hypothetical protein
MVEETLGVPVLHRPIRITLAPTRSEFRRIIREATGGREPPGKAIAVALPVAGRMVILASALEPFSDNSLPVTMRHEMVHLAFAPARPPRWFDEGVAEYVAGRRVRGPQKGLLRAAAISGDLPPLEELSGRFPSGEGMTRAYAQSLSVVRYMADRFGEEGLRRVIRRVVQGEDLGWALRVETGVSLETLETDWLQATREDPSFLVEMLEDPRYIWEMLFIGMACLVLLAVARRALRRRKALARMDDDDPFAP